MPMPGLSLVGFMDQPMALAHFRQDCVPANSDDAALTAEWRAAQAQLDVQNLPVHNPGRPAFQPIPAAHQPYIAALRQVPWVAQYLASIHQPISFEMVELDPLLAYQFSVNMDRSQHHCGALTNPPTLQEMLPICLPQQEEAADAKVLQQAQSVILKAPTLNFRVVAQGPLGPAPGAINAAGIVFAVSLPLLHVTRWNGLCFLHNGFHRAVGIRKAGALEAPCLVRDVATPQEVGIGPNTFAEALLTSANPPTIAHFTQGRAYDVQLRKFSRIMHVSWSEYTMPEE